MKTPRLETARLVLRPIALSDAPAIQKHFNNWNIIRNLSMAVPWPYPDDGAESFICNVALPKMATGRAYIWVLVLKEGDGEAIGVVEVDEGSRGNWLAERHQGLGYMTEAITAVQDFLFFDAGFDRIKITNAKINTQSSKVQKKTGGVHIGMIEFEHRSGATESELWEVTRERWAKIRGRNIAPAPG